MKNASFYYGKKNKISPCNLPDLQLTLHGIKINTKVPNACQKNI